MKHLLIHALAIFLPTFLTATTIIPFEHLGALARYSEAIVLARAETIVESQRGNSTYQDTRFRVLSAAKGPLTEGQFFDVRPLSKQSGAYYAEVAGDFTPTPGQTYLLFLYQSNGCWRSHLLSYYVFESRHISGENVLFPMVGTAGVEVLPRPDGVVPEALYPYKQELLLQLLRDYADGTATQWNAESARLGLNPGAAADDRVIPSQCDFMLGSSTVLARWINSSIDVYYDDTALPSGFNGTLNTILSGLTSNYTGIFMFNNGQVTYVPDCSDGTPTNSGELFPFFDTNMNGTQSVLIMFDDPCNELPALSSCGGTLAYGGSYRFGTSSNHVYKGDTWQNCGYGYVVVNDGVTTCYTGAPLQQMLQHELTHVYRLDHISATNYPNHNMNPLCCSAINFGERECMNYAYDIALLPVELREFNVKAAVNQIIISWKTETEHRNTAFILERSGDGIRFQPLARVAAGLSGGQYTWTDQHPLNGRNYYRLSQLDADGSQSNLGVRSVSIEGAGAQFSLSPNPVLPGQGGTLLLQSAQAWEGVVEIAGPDGQVYHRETVSVESGVFRLALPVRELPAGVYRVVIRGTDGVSVLNWSKL